jgi:hypothetical protein
MRIKTIRARRRRKSPIREVYVNADPYKVAMWVVRQGQSGRMERHTRKPCGYRSFLVQ